MAAAFKRSLLNKPSWASRTAPSADKPAEKDIFRSRDYEGILEAERKRKEEDAAKAKARAEKKARAERVEGTREPKRRRISDGREDDDSAASRDSEDEQENEADGIRRVTQITPVEKRSSVDGNKRDSPKHYAGQRQPNAKKATTIELSDDDDDGDIYAPSASREVEKTPPEKSKFKSQYLDPPSDEDDDEDDYTRELKRKAREKARLQKLGVEVGKPYPPVPRTAVDYKSPSLPPESGSPRQTTAPAPIAQAPEDPLVQIAINTTIPGTRPLIVNRRASQSLKLVKEVWCDRQGFDAAKTAKIFLTWRGNKLFNASTLRPILERLKAERPREVFTVVDGEDGQPEPNKGGIELEAMTEEIFEETRRRKEREVFAVATPGAGDDNTDSLSPSAGQDEPVKPTEDKIVIQLVCQETGNMVLRVRPTTTIDKIMMGFKSKMKVDASKTPWLLFDGERLERDATVEDVGFEDEDSVEVHLR